jgi:hypothetical protein
MPGNDLGPPEKEDRPPENRKPTNSLSGHHATPTSDDFTPQTVETAGNAGWRRRREASWRLPVLDSERSDPWYYEPPGVIGYEAAAVHLLSQGLTPALNLPALQAMWKAGGKSRRVAQVIAELWELAA